MALGTIGELMSQPFTHDGDVRIEDFTIFGYKTFAEGRAAEIHELITAAETVRTLDGAPTLTVTVDDARRVLSHHALLTYRITMVLDTYAFELAGVRKSGDTFTLTFEDVIVAEMRRSRDPRKIPPQTMSRVEFAYLLLSEIPPVDFVTPGIDLQVTKVELARGKDIVRPGTDPEDTWKALTRIFAAVGWRFWVDRGKVFAAPDPYLTSLPSVGTLVENTGPVYDIDYDIDSGKPVAKATLTVESARWSLPIGARADIDGPGPESGAWIVSEIRRSLYSTRSTVTLVRPKAPLPEPPSQPDSGDVQAIGQGSAGALTGSVGSGAAGGGTTGGSPGSAEVAVRFALSKEGGPYVWGGTGPTGYDCSGLVQAAFGAAGAGLPRVSSSQYGACKDAGLALSVDTAAHTRGAILERSPDVRGDSGHIAISLGSGNETIEAMGSAYGIRKGTVAGRFNHGARVPGVTY